MGNLFFEKMFTDSVKQSQARYGSRKAYERIEANSSSTLSDVLGDVEIDFIETRDGFYMATVNDGGQPYIQFRGGPAGFLKVLDERTLGFADFRGNLQYISVGNLKANDRAALFLMDYAHQRRLKMIARTKVKDAVEVPDLITKLQMPGYKAMIERAMILHIEAFDWNCPQHITPRYTMDEIKPILMPLYKHIQKLESEISDLKKNQEAYVANQKASPKTDSFVCLSPLKMIDKGLE